MLPTTWEDLQGFRSLRLIWFDERASEHPFGGCSNPFPQFGCCRDPIIPVPLQACISEFQIRLFQFVHITNWQQQDANDLILLSQEKNTKKEIREPTLFYESSHKKTQNVIFLSYLRDLSLELSSWNGGQPQNFNTIANWSWYFIAGARKLYPGPKYEKI